MVKPNRAVSREEALGILRAGRVGVLSTVSAEGQPYGVPVNYCYSELENCIFFHCARTGQKLNNIRANDRVSFVVVGHEQVMPERFITHYESAVVAGRACVVLDEVEMVDKLTTLCDKFAPGVLARRDDVIRKYLPAVAICKITIDDITGKRNSDD